MHSWGSFSAWKASKNIDSGLIALNFYSIYSLVNADFHFSVFLNYNSLKDNRKKFVEVKVQLILLQYWDS